VKTKSKRKFLRKRDEGKVNIRINKRVAITEAKTTTLLNPQQNNYLKQLVNNKFQR
jgi:hypothetical protein